MMDLATTAQVSVGVCDGDNRVNAISKKGQHGSWGDAVDRRLHGAWRMKTLTDIVLYGTALTILSMSTGCTASKGKAMGIDEVRRAVDAGNANWITAMRTQDSALLASLFDPQGSMLGSGGAVHRGPAAVREAMGGLMDKWGPTETTIDTDNLWVVDDIAFETGRYTYTYTLEGGDKTVDRGRYVVRWKRQPDGSWKIETDLGLPDH